MTFNKEDLKNKIIYRASYRGTKEMDIMVSSYVKKIINDLSYDELVLLDKIINLDDEKLISIKKKESAIDYKEKKILNIIDRFQKY